MSRLPKIAPTPPDDFKKNKYKELTEELTEELSELQNLLYAEGKHSLLIVLQGMDAAGKDGAIKKVFSGVNPMGCRVKPFKKPTEREMAHDFLWRVHQHVPQQGMIQIFNRSHYEDVLIQRVHQWVDMDTIKRRYDYINSFERLLQENGTHILKFYLHISQEEQHERLSERLKMRHKMWKYNPGDMKESERWDEYMEAYEDVFEYCSPEIPWTIVPANKNWFKEYTIANSIVELLRSLNMEYPSLNK